MKVSSAKPYRLCRLVNFGGDVSRRWFLVYYLWSEEQKKLVRCRYTAINHSSNSSVRYLAASNAKTQIDSLLKNGAIHEDQSVDEKEATKLGNKKLLVVLGMAREWKEKSLRKYSKKHFSSLMYHLERYVPEKGLKSMPFSQLDYTQALKFRDYLLDTIKSNRTVNNYINAFSSLVSEAMRWDKTALKENPFKELKSLKVQVRKHAAFSREEMQKLLNIMTEQKEQQLMLFARFMFYTLARPNELCQLRVGNIDLSEQRLYIPEHVSKNRKSDFVDIYDPLKKVITESGILNYDPSYYIFTSLGVPGPKYAYDKFFWRRNVKILEASGLKANGRSYDLYSYKHSGACSLYLAGLDLLTIQKQLRHQNPSETMKYLKDLELMRDKSHFAKVFVV